MSSQTLGVCVALGIAVFMVVMLRRGVLREKFAALWLLVSLVLLVLAVFPAILNGLTAVLGVQVPANLLFLLAIVLLLLVSVQLSHEVSRVESRTRRLAEELALLQYEVGRLRRDRDPS